MEKNPREQGEAQRDAWPGASEDSWKTSVPSEPSLALGGSLLKQRKASLVTESVAKPSLFTFVPCPGLDRRTTPVKDVCCTLRSVRWALVEIVQIPGTTAAPLKLATFHS